MTAIDVYLDLTCPYSYLAFLRVQDVAKRNGASVNWHPVLVERVLETENPALAESRLDPLATKAAWQRQDIDLWANYWGIKLDIPVDWPYTAEAASRGALLAIHQGQGVAYLEQAFRMVFEQGKSLNDDESLASLASNAGMKGEEFTVALQDEDLHKRLQVNARDLIRRGGFGTPTMYVGERMYFGNDHITLVEWDVGPVSDTSFVAPGQHGAA
ncbi:MAG: 2-hydroxychromene-2-carboxylate isomerase [Gammaproteobacteria bacterium]